MISKEPAPTFRMSLPSAPIPLRGNSQTGIGGTGSKDRFGSCRRLPSSQTFIEVKIAETAMAVMTGADEIDVVMNLGYFMEENYEELTEEIQEIKESCRESKLKVILETGAPGHSGKYSESGHLSPLFRRRFHQDIHR